MLGENLDMDVRRELSDCSNKLRFLEMGSWATRLSCVEEAMSGVPRREERFALDTTRAMLVDRVAFGTGLLDMAVVSRGFLPGQFPVWIKGQVWCV